MAFTGFVVTVPYPSDKGAEIWSNPVEAQFTAHRNLSTVNIDRVPLMPETPLEPKPARVAAGDEAAAAGEAAFICCLSHDHYDCIYRF